MSRSRFLLQTAVVAGPMLSMIDSAIVTIALPQLGLSLHRSASAAQATITGYLVGLGCGLVAVPLLERAWGRLGLYRVALTAFTLASLACAMCTSLPMLVVARVIQGVAGAPLVPMAMALIYPGRDSEVAADDEPRAAAPAAIGAAAGLALFVAPALSPALGGLLLWLGNWRWLFAVNVPIGLVAVLALRGPRGGALETAHAQPAKQPTIDPPLGRSAWRHSGLLLGMVWLATAIGLTQFATERLSHPTSWGVALLFLGGSLLLGYAMLSARLESGPTPATRWRLPLRVGLLGHDRAWVAMALIGVATVLTYTVLVFIPSYVQTVGGHSALTAGLLSLPAGIATGLVSVIADRAVTRIGLRAVVLLGLGLLVVGGLLVLLVDPGTPMALIALVLTCRSIGIGLVAPPLVGLIARSAPSSDAGDLHTLFNVIQRLAAALGIGMLSALFVAVANSRGQTVALHSVVLALLLPAAVGLALVRLLPRAASIQAAAA